jgi:hypothetical protein
VAQQPETYTRTISTMSEIIGSLNDESDPDGTLAALADRIAAERAWVRTLMALGEEPLRPPGWLRRIETQLAKTPAGRSPGAAQGRVERRRFLGRSLVFSGGLRWR